MLPIRKSLQEYITICIQFKNPRLFPSEDTYQISSKFSFNKELILGRILLQRQKGNEISHKSDAAVVAGEVRNNKLGGNFRSGTRRWSMRVAVSGWKQHTSIYLMELVTRRDKTELNKDVFGFLKTFEVYIRYWL